MNTPSNCECPLSDLHRQLTVKIWLPTWQEVSTNTTSEEMLRKPDEQSYEAKKMSMKMGWMQEIMGKHASWFWHVLCQALLKWIKKNDIIFVPWMDGFTGGYMEGWQRIYLDRNCYRTPLNDKQRASVLRTWIEYQVTEYKYTSKQRNKYTNVRYKNAHKCIAQVCKYTVSRKINTSMEASVLQTWFESQMTEYKYTHKQRDKYTSVSRSVWGIQYKCSQMQRTSMQVYNI